MTVSDGAGACTSGNLYEKDAKVEGEESKGDVTSQTTEPGPSRIRGWLREATQHSLTYGLGAALQAALNFVLLPLYTKQFAADEFGVFRMAVLAGSLAGAVFYLGAYSSLSRFYFD